MTRGIENRGYNGGIDFTDPKVRSRAALGVSGNGGRSPESLKTDSVEIRFANLEKDIKAIAGIFSEPGIIEHLSGVAPAMTKKNIKSFRLNIKERMPDVTLVDIPIIIATEDEIKKLYDDATSRELLVAVVDDKVVGTITIERAGLGILWGQISRLAVSESAKGKGIGRKLLKAVNDRMFNQLGYRGASAGIIRGVDGDTIPFHLFEREGYSASATQRDICLGWSLKEDGFVYRDSLRVTREIPREATPKNV